MKKLLTLIMFLALTISLSAQDITKNHPVGNFTGINAGGVFEITLAKSSSSSVSTTASSEVSQYIEVKVKDGVLHLDLDTDKMPNSLKRNMKSVKATITIAQLEKLFLSGASRLKSSGIFSPATFKGDFSGAVTAEGLIINAGTASVVVSGASRLEMKGKSQIVKYDISGASNVMIDQDASDVKLGGSGAAKMDYSGNSTQFELSISGATKVKMKGSATTAIFEASGASNLDAENFIVKDVDIEASGVSNVTTNVTGSISAEISGGSTVRYTGNPVMKNIETSSGASIKRITAPK
jgi:hypothetical protein